MSLIETESLILKTYNLAEADKIVVLFTREHGIVRGVAKGAKRLKSRFGSSLEPFSEVRVTYFQKENIELVSVDKIEIIRSIFGPASDPAFLQKFSYLAELLIAFLPPHDPNEMLYRMTRACIDKAVGDETCLQSLGVYFELWLLRLTGYLPDWSKCQHCQRTLDDREEADLQANFDLLCSGCRRARSSRRMDATHRALVFAGLRLSPSDFAEQTSERIEQLGQLSTTLRSLISHSLGREVSGESPVSAAA